MTITFKRPLIVSASVILGSIVIAVVGFFYLSQSIADQAGRIAKDRADIAAQTTALASIAKLRAEATQAAVYTSAMGKLLPTHDGLISFGQWISRIATTDHVSASVSFRGNDVMPSNDAFGRAGISLDMSAPIANIIAFLNDIESKTPGFLLSLASLDLVPSGSDYRLSAQGTLFFREQ